MSIQDKPQPRINRINAPFWQACNEGKLLLQQCQSDGCQQWIYFPRVCCPYCGSGDLGWKEASGKGRIETYSVIRRPQHSSFFPEAPYYFIAVRLDEGPLLYSRLDHPYEAELDPYGARVRVVYTPHGDAQLLPFFAFDQ